MSLIGSEFELSSYKRQVAMKYVAFLSPEIPSALHASLLQDLRTLCMDSSTDSCIQEVTEIIQHRNPMVIPDETVKNVVLAIQKCNSPYPLYQLLFLIDPASAINIFD